MINSAPVGAVIWKNIVKRSEVLCCGFRIHAKEVEKECCLHKIVQRSASSIKVKN